jgi:hypothetical protein
VAQMKEHGESKWLSRMKKLVKTDTLDDKGYAGEKERIYLGLCSVWRHSDLMLLKRNL